MVRRASVWLSDAQYEWLGQSAHDRGCTVGSLIREGIDRAMSANPTTSNDEINDLVADYTKAGGSNGRQPISGDVRAQPGPKRKRTRVRPNT